MYMHVVNQASAPVDEEVPAQILHLIQSAKSLSNSHQASRNRFLVTRINFGVCSFLVSGRPYRYAGAYTCSRNPPDPWAREVT